MSRKSGLRPVSSVIGAQPSKGSSISLALLLAVGIAITLLRGGPAGVSAASAITDADAALDTAAAALEVATDTGGTGVSFRIVSRSTLRAWPNGPKIEVPDPIDPHKSLGLADTYDVGGSLATGYATANGFFLQMRRGAATPGEAVDFMSAEPTLASLVTGDGQWRNDGHGWYATDTIPGIGLDPRTLELLPKLLRDASAAKAAPPVTVDGVSRATVSATGTVENAPGLMAIDASSFTEITAPIEFAFDEQGRLVGLTAHLRNTRSETFELVVDTTILLTYDGVPRDLPEPVPSAPPPPTPEPDPWTVK